MSETEMGEALRQWRQAHPTASWDEIESEVQRQLAGLQAAWMGELAGATRPDEVERTCLECGVRLQASGQRTRRVLTRMGRPVPLERRYFVCPSCGTGVFPPG